MFFKKVILAASMGFLSMSAAINANEIADTNSLNSDISASGDGVLKFSGLVNLICDTPETCGTYSSGWHRATVYENFIIDVPPRLEMRLYWKQNVPAGIAAGRYRAKTIGDECPDGTKMTATWFLTSGGTPHYANSKDCDGVIHGFRVVQFP